MTGATVSSPAVRSSTESPPLHATRASAPTANPAIRRRVPRIHLSSQSSASYPWGALSTIDPFSRIPLSIWRDALLAVSPAEMMKRGNVAAFLAGREAVG